MVAETVKIVIGLIGLLAGAALVVVALFSGANHHEDKKE